MSAQNRRKDSNRTQTSEPDASSGWREEYHHQGCPQPDGEHVVALAKTPRANVWVTPYTVDGAHVAFLRRLGETSLTETRLDPETASNLAEVSVETHLRQITESPAWPQAVGDDDRTVDEALVVDLGRHGEGEA